MPFERARSVRRRVVRAVYLDPLSRGGPIAAGLRVVGCCVLSQEDEVELVGVESLDSGDGEPPDRVRPQCAGQQADDQRTVRVGFVRAAWLGDTRQPI